MNKVQLAKVFGVSTVTVDKWVSKGCPVDKAGRNGAQYEFQLPAVITWRVEELVNQALGIMKTDDKDIAEALRREAFAKAEIREIELAALRKDMIHIDTADKLIARGIMDARSHFLSLPTKLAPVLIVCKSVAQIKARLEKGVRDALESVCRIKLSEDVLEPDVEPVGPAADADRQRVGGQKQKAQPRKQRRARPVGHVPG